MPVFLEMLKEWAGNINSLVLHQKLEDKKYNFHEDLKKRNRFINRAAAVIETRQPTLKSDMKFS